MAPSLAAFWRLWNPVVGYFLAYGVYQPLRRWCPRRLSLLLTFVVCGLAHGLLAWLLTREPRALAGATTWFALIGATVVLTERWGLALHRVPAAGRWLIHLGDIALCGWLTILLVQSWLD
jgi:hypothetical protein